MKRFSKWGLLLYLLALLPLNVHADIYKYGIFDGTTYTDVGYLYATWNAEYHSMLEAQEINADLSGSGTQQDPYKIYDVWDLCRLEDKVNAIKEALDKVTNVVTEIHSQNEGDGHGEEVTLDPVNAYVAQYKN